MRLHSKDQGPFKTLLLACNALLPRPAVKSPGNELLGKDDKSSVWVEECQGPQ